MSNGIVFLNVYSCPGCGAELEAGNEPSPSWLRCPNCGRPSLPPDELVRRGSFNGTGDPVHHRAGISGEDLLYISGEPAPRRRRAISASRIFWSSVAIAVPVGVCIVMGRELFETVLIGGVMAFTMMLLYWSSARR